MARKKSTTYAKLLQEGDKFQQPDSQIENIWTVKRVDDQGDGYVKVFVENRMRAFVLHRHERVRLYHR